MKKTQEDYCTLLHDTNISLKELCNRCMLSSWVHLIPPFFMFIIRSSLACILIILQNVLIVFYAYVGFLLLILSFELALLVYQCVKVVVHSLVTLGYFLFFFYPHTTEGVQRK